MPNSAIVIPIEYDFAPAAQQEDITTNLDTFINTLSPWGYWKCNETSGMPQDTSGNNRHCLYVDGTASYSQSPITSKVGNSMKFENARARFPSPFQRLGALANTWTIGGLFYIEAEVGSGSPAQSVQGSPFFGQTPAGAYFYQNSDIYISIALTYGSVIIIRSGGQVGGGSVYPMQLNQPMSVFLVGSSVPGISFTVDVFINGILFGTTMRGNAGAGNAGEFQVGRCQDNGAPYTRVRASNICAWATELTQHNIVDLTKLMMDKAAYQTAWKP